MRNLQEQVKKSIILPNFFWPFTVWINCSRFLKMFFFKSFSRSLEHFFLTVGQKNFGNKIPILVFKIDFLMLTGNPLPHLGRIFRVHVYIGDLFFRHQQWIYSPDIGQLDPRENLWNFPYHLQNCHFIIGILFFKSCFDLL